jgi:signal peptidase I
MVMSRNRIRIKIVILSAVSGIAILMAAMVIARSLVFELLIINGPSMRPTIMQGDRILVSKLTYKLRKPSRGDIIAFRMGLRRLVKRVVGLPGDVIEIRDGLLYRDGEVFANKPQVALHRHPRRRSHRLRTVKDKHVFVIGDNSSLSVDSRDFGTISYEDIIGKAVFIYSPLKRIGRLK